MFSEAPKRLPLGPGLWRLFRRPGSELRANETEVLVTELPSSGIVIVTTADGAMPLNWQFLRTHFLLDQAIRLDQRTGQPYRS